MKEDTLRDLRTQCGILLRIFKEVNDLCKFFFFFIGTGHIGKGDLVLRRIVETGLTAAEVHGRTAFALIPAEVYPDEEDHGRQHQDDHNT